MRCLSIADAASEIEQDIVFVTAGDECKAIIQSRGYDNIVLQVDYQKLEEELDQLFSVISRLQVKIVLIDSYFVTRSYLEQLKNYCTRQSCRLVYIDDILAFPYPCDVLINYNIYGSEKEEYYKRLYSDKKKNLPMFLLGTTYVPLRKEFQNLSPRNTRVNACDILISTGGTDIEHLTIALLRVVLDRKDKYRFHFIVGPMNEDIGKIKKIAEGKDNIIIHENVKRMQYLMRECDVAISAAGSTLYELCATRTPTITYILSDNQILGAKAFEKYGLIKNLGDIRRKGCEELAMDLIKEIILLIKDYQKREEVSHRMGKHIDGNGASRIAENLRDTIS